MTKRDQADLIAISAFEAHLAEGKPWNIALDAVSYECDALADEKGISRRTLRHAVNLLSDRVHDGRVNPTPGG